jgi:hypothetical protein
MGASVTLSFYGLIKQTCQMGSNYTNAWTVAQWDARTLPSRKMHLKTARLVDVIAVGLGSLNHCLATLVY